jgi:serine/threonine protein kinase
MSWFSRFRPKKAPPPEAPASPSPPASPQPRFSRDIDRLIRVGEPNGASLEEALITLRGLHATPDEGLVLERLVGKAAQKPLPEPLAVAGASALVDRGEPAVALRLLAGAASSPALLMAADLRAERGEVAVALALSERVLLRDLDHPGARERHRRWRSALGLDPSGPRVDANVVTVATSKPEAPFLMLREVARGGSGAVYEAEDRELGRKVALKVYHRPERDRAQLLHEAQVPAALVGPGIVRVFDVDPEDGWLALEWAALGSLRDHVRTHSHEVLAPLERWARPLAVALARVHAAGWVHHDVKPANVLLNTPDSPAFADFGTARRAGEPSPPGSLGYLSPERLRGRISDARDDVYGFGRILEDVLDGLGDRGLTERWHALTAACVGPDEGRPADGRALATRMRIETA